MSTIKANNHQIGSSATPSQNQTWYQPLTPDGTVRLGVGNSGATTLDAITVDSSGNVTVAGALNSAGGQPVWHGAQGTAQTTNGAAAYGYTGIPSWVKRITMIFSGVYNSSTGYLSNRIQIGSGSYVTSGYTCAYAQISGSAAGSNNVTDGFLIYGGGALATAISGQVSLSLLSSSSNTWTISGSVTPGGTNTGFVSGAVTLSGTLDRIQLSATSGTYSGGTINVIYEG